MGRWERLDAILKNSFSAVKEDLQKIKGAILSLDREKDTQSKKIELLMDRVDNLYSALAEVRADSKELNNLKLEIKELKKEIDRLKIKKKEKKPVKIPKGIWIIFFIIVVISAISLTYYIFQEPINKFLTNVTNLTAFTTVTGTIDGVKYNEKDYFQVLKVKEGELVKLDVKATDEDGNPLTYAFSEPLDTKGEWQTKKGDAGTYVITVSVSDGEITTYEEVLLIVEAVE